MDSIEEDEEYYEEDYKKKISIEHMENSLQTVVGSVTELIDMLSEYQIELLSLQKRLRCIEIILFIQLCAIIWFSNT
tara:strand:+ start:279 stop:509 length:231 start_codon:yes stop_codon:yes gene_type:complete